MGRPTSYFKLNVRKNESQILSRCLVTVAHCIVGTARTFPRPEVYSSIARHLVGPSAARECVRIFFVLDLSSRQDSPKGGSFDYAEELLWRGAWLRLPPAGYWIDPPLPALRKHASYLNPWCIFQCVPMFDKNRRCLSLVRAHEQATSHRFDWIVRSRPDLKWSPGGGTGSLARLSPNFVYMQFARWKGDERTLPLDQVLVLPRRFSEPLMGAILEQCHTMSDAEENDCRTWSCDCWIKIFMERAGIRGRPLDFRYTIARVLGAADSHASAPRYGWNTFLMHNRMIRAAIAGREDPMFSRGGAPVQRSSLAPVDAGQGRAACVTHIDGDLCLQRAALLLSVEFYLAAGVLSSRTKIRFSTWAPTAVRSEESSGLEQFSLRDTLPIRGYNWSKFSTSPGMRSIILKPPVRLRDGDCLGRTVCGSDPFPYDELPPRDCLERSAASLVAFSEDLPGRAGPLADGSVALQFRRGACQRYSVSATLYDEQMYAEVRQASSS